ncbi:hypothetical protein [Rhizobacter sp. P5_C2]
MRKTTDACRSIGYGGSDPRVIARHKGAKMNNDDDLRHGDDPQGIPIDAEATNQAWARRSPSIEDQQLTSATVHWLDALPHGVRPVHLPDDFPRIANDLCRLWPTTPALDLYFEEKEFSLREDRRGFPALIKEELLALHVHSLHTRPLPYEVRAPQRASLLG